MAELSTPTMADIHSAEIKFKAGMVEPQPGKVHPRPSRGLVIALPIHRTDLPALMLMLLAFSLIGWWGWATSQPNSLLATPDPSSTTWEPLLLSLFHQKAISLTLTLTAVLLILAAALAVSPLRWWAYLRFVAKTGIVAQWRQFQRRSPEPDDAEAWVAAQAAWLEEMQATVAQEEAAQRSAASEETATEANGQANGQTGEPSAASPQAAAAQATDPAAQATTPAAQAVEPGTEAQGATAQGATTPAADGQQPANEPAVGAPQDPAAAPADPNAPQLQAEKAPDAAAPAQPKAAVPKGQQASAEMAALAEETKEEALDLNDLTDVQDILNSFADNDVISAELLALSATLDDIALATLVQQCDAVAVHLATGSRIREETAQTIPASPSLAAR